MSALRDRETDDHPGTVLACEACGARGSSPSEPWTLGDRVFWLCAAHRAQANAASDADALRALFREPGGQRSVLPRRTEERRVFPPRPEGRRKGTGRRRLDPDA